MMDLEKQRWIEERLMALTTTYTAQEGQVPDDSQDALQWEINILRQNLTDPSSVDLMVVRNPDGSFFYSSHAEPTDYLLLLPYTEEPPQELSFIVEDISLHLLEHLRKHPEELHNIRPRQFEELVAEILARYGWRVLLTPAGKDGGYDLYAISQDETGLQTSWIIECKKYKEAKVGIKIVRELWGVKQDLRVAMCMVATTSSFTKGVHEFKQSRYDLELQDYKGILDWINAYRPNPNGQLYIKDFQLALPDKENRYK